MVKNSEVLLSDISSFSLLGIVLSYSCMAGKTMATLTHHKKSVRAMAQHPIEYVSTRIFFFLSFLLILVNLPVVAFIICRVLIWSNILLAGTALHLHQLTTLKNLIFQKESSCTTCCEFCEHTLYLLQ